jgi:1,4-alpha-glucan branching enzyme
MKLSTTEKESEMSITSIPAGIEAELGGHLANQGATFRIWAPNAREVYLIWGNQDRAQRPTTEWQLERQGEHFVGFVAPAQDGDLYRYWIVGPDGEGPKRDPHARELEWRGYPNCDGILRDPTAYPWASSDRYRRPKPHELVLYQLHVGTFFYQDSAGNDLRRTQVGRFLDVLDRFEHLRQLNISGVQLLPIVEWQTSRSLGYNGTDLFSPEMDHFVPKNELGRYVDLLNRLRAEAGAPALAPALLESGVNQLKALIDLFHLYDIAVFFDVVYNHAGGNFDDQSIRLIDYHATRSNPHGPYFQNAGWAGGIVFDYEAQGVRRFLIENAVAMSEEYQSDGHRRAWRLAILSGADQYALATRPRCHQRSRVLEGGQELGDPRNRLGRRRLRCGMARHLTRRDSRRDRCGQPGSPRLGEHEFAPERLVPHLRRGQALGCRQLHRKPRSPQGRQR